MCLDYFPLIYSPTVSIWNIAGKYPHLVVNGSGTSEAKGHNGGQELETVINFDTVSVGQSVQKWIELTNMAPVNAPFQIDHYASRGRIDTVFRCVQKEGVVPAKSTVRVPVSITCYFIIFPSDFLIFYYIFIWCYYIFQ